MSNKSNGLVVILKEDATEDEMAMLIMAIHKAAKVLSITHNIERDPEAHTEETSIERSERIKRELRWITGEGA